MHSSYNSSKRAIIVFHDNRESDITDEFYFTYNNSKIPFVELYRSVCKTMNAKEIRFINK